jgi:3-hydroxybutyryl-CoA dehydrogenase
MEIKQVFIRDAGLMGSGIAQFCAQAGIRVALNDVSQQFLDNGLQVIAWSACKARRKGQIVTNKETILGRSEKARDFFSDREPDLAIEVIFGNLNEEQNYSGNWMRPALPLR